MPATEKPRAEPEIIPPGDLDGRPMRDRYHFDVHGGSQRIYVTRLGPFGIVVLGLLIALIAAVIPIVLLGALLIWIPVAVLFVAAAVVSGLLRGRDSVPPSPAEAPASPPLAETTDAVRDERASQLVDRLSLWSGAAGLIPLPLVDMAAVGGVQLYMLRRLSEIYEIPFSENLGKSILSSLAGAVIPATTATTAASVGAGVASAVGEFEMIADPKRKLHQDSGNQDSGNQDSGNSEKRRRQEEELDEALKNTFPASDPVSMEQP